MPSFGVGFTLICFQRLSCPNIATQPCRWRDNWNTRGSSAPVLSYKGQLSASILHPHQRGTDLAHAGLNPAHVPLLIGEQPNPWDLLQPQDAMSRHRGAKPPRRYGRSGEISLLSPEYLLSVDLWPFHTGPQGH